MGEQAEARDPSKKAYDQGCMWGMSGRGRDTCPYTDDNLASWWEAGWLEGYEAWQRRQESRQAV